MVAGMNREQVLRCYLLWASAHNIEPSDTGILAWYAALDDVDGDAGYAATVDLVRTSTRMFRAGDVRQAVLKGNGDLPPDEETALGYYLSGQWDRHPAIAKAANDVHWDRFEVPDRATYQFRQLYRSAVDAEGNQRREGIGRGDPAAIGDLLGDAQPEGDDDGFVGDDDDGFEGYGS